MKKIIKQVQAKTRKHNWLRFTLRVLGILVLFLAIVFCVLYWYITSHQEEVKAEVSRVMNNSTSGSVQIGSLEPALLQSFPSITVKLNDVVLRDSLYNNHKHTLLDAGEVYASLDMPSFLGGKTEVHYIRIKNADVDIFTDSLGYSNTEALKEKKKETTGSSEGSIAIHKIRLDNVRLRVEDLQKKKLHKINLDKLQADVNYNDNGWNTNVSLKGFVDNLAFNTDKGSYINDKQIEGKLKINYNKANGNMAFAEKEFKIGDDAFLISGKFSTKQKDIPFELTFKNNKILWDNALALLAPNISKKIRAYSLKKPFKVEALIKGKLSKRGNPYVQVKAFVNNNLLDTPGGPVDNCSFNAVYDNNLDTAAGYTDENSGIAFSNFKGSYSGIDFFMDKAVVENLKKPIAYGNFTSTFDMPKLSSLVDSSLLQFKNGSAHVKLNFSADIVNFKLARPLVTGIITVKDADMVYVPRGLNFNDVSVNLNFTKDDLYISRMNLKGNNSIVEMEGKINNFLNLYYQDPQKVVLQWEVNSPKLYLDEFMTFAGGKKRGTIAEQRRRKGDFTEDVNTLFDKSSVDLKVKIDKLYYKKFYAADATASVNLTDDGITVHNAGLWHSGGYIAMNGSLLNGKGSSKYRINTKIKDVDVSRFLETFSNFGMEALKAENLKGQLNTNASLTGSITENGALVPNTIAGSLSFGLDNARLLNFEPVKDIGKFAFPFRDFDNISFSGLEGKFDIKGDRVTIYPMEISTSVLNMDVEGVYSFGRGTAIYIAVPLRNPKRDEDITNEEKLAKRRHRGIVLHLVAADDKNGKVKVKLGKKKE